MGARNQEHRDQAGSDEASEEQAELARLRRRIAELEASEARLRAQLDRARAPAPGAVDAGELLTMLLENVPDYVYFKDADRRFVLASRSFTELLGRELSEIIDHRDEDLFPPDIAVETIADDRGVIERGVPILDKLEGGEVSAGVERWVSTTKLPWRGEDGGVRGLYGISRDVTERVRAERALRESERSFRELCNSLPHCIGTCDSEGSVDFLNQRWLDYTGRPAEEQLGGGWLSQLHPEDRGPTLAAWRSSVASGESFRIECRIRGRDGEYRPFDARAVRICDAEGGAVRWFGSCTDISELKSAQMQLIQAGKLAALGTFGAGVAHELNQPLTVIRLLTERLQIAGVGAEALGGIARQVSRMARIVNNLLAFSHKSAPRREVIGAVQPLEAALELMAAQLRLAGVAVDRRYDEELSAVAVDPVHVQSVFFNLLTNALHALETKPEGAPRRLELSVAEGEGRLRYRVRDNGPGVSDKSAKQLFDPFFTTKEAGKGTGLGLSLAYGILKEHGGSIRFEACSSEGASFLVELPVASQGPLRPSLSRGGQARAAPSKPGGRRVLVVDDESAVRSALSGLIREWGYITIEASCGREALAAISEAPPEIAFVDLTLPQESGIDICAAIRERDPEIRIVPISGYATPKNRRELVEMGIPVILEKPMEPSDLLSVLEELPDRAGAEGGD